MAKTKQNPQPKQSTIQVQLDRLREDIDGLYSRYREGASQAIPMERPKPPIVSTAEALAQCNEGIGHYKNAMDDLADRMSALGKNMTEATALKAKLQRQLDRETNE